jgi:hypothetical protein
MGRRLQGGDGPRLTRTAATLRIAAFDIDGVVQPLLLALVGQLHGVAQRRAPAGEMQGRRFVDGQRIQPILGGGVEQIEGHHGAETGCCLCHNVRIAP